MKIVFYLLAVVFVVVMLPLSVSAHTFKSVDGIGVTSHIEPNDEPIANEPANIFIEISGGGEGAMCDCQVIIEQEGVPLKTFPLRTNVLSSNFVFPESGIAKIVVRGTFGGPFEVVFDYYIRSGSGVAGSQRIENSLHIYSPYVTIAGLMLVVLFLFMPKQLSRV